MSWQEHYYVRIIILENCSLYYSFYRDYYSVKLEFLLLILLCFHFCGDFLPWLLLAEDDLLPFTFCLDIYIYQWQSVYYVIIYVENIVISLFKLHFLVFLSVTIIFWTDWNSLIGSYIMKSVKQLFLTLEPITHFLTSQF